MKFTKYTIGLLALFAGVAMAQVPEIAYWAGGGTDVGTSLCYTVVSKNVKNGGTPVLTYLNVTSDLSSSKVQFYNTGTPTTCNYTNATVSIPVVSTNGFPAATGIVVIWHRLTDTYERRILDTYTSSTNLTTTVASTAAVIPGDQIYPMSTTGAGTIPVGAATKELNAAGGGIYAGQSGKPMLIEIDGTSACQVNAAAAKFER